MMGGFLFLTGCYFYHIDQTTLNALNIFLVTYIHIQIGLLLFLAKGVIAFTG